MRVLFALLFMAGAAFAQSLPIQVPANTWVDLGAGPITVRVTERAIHLITKATCPLAGAGPERGMASLRVVDAPLPMSTTLKVCAFGGGQGGQVVVSPIK